MFKSNVKRYIYLGLQIMDINTYIADFFVKSTSVAGITANSVTYVKPALQRPATPSVPASCEFFATVPYPNGHYVSCPSCIPIPVLRLMALPSEGNGLALEEGHVSAGEWSVYPNPTTGAVTLSAKLQTAANSYHVDVLDINGKTVYQKSFAQRVEATQPIQASFDLSAFPDGIYFVRATADGNVLLNQKIILNK